jgi:hypothetical protein
VLDDVALQTVRDGRKTETKGAQIRLGEWKTCKSIREGGEPPIPYEQLIGVTQSTFAAVESIRTGERIQIS